MTAGMELTDDLPTDSLPALGHEQGLEMLKWFRRRKEAAELARADAHELVRTYGKSASNVAHIFEYDAVLPDGTTHKGRTSEQWRCVALLIENMVPVRP
jgi:predicted hydrolase (HD superfamily)